jgi:hypothetical protein
MDSNITIRIITAQDNAGIAHIIRSALIEFRCQARYRVL